VKLLINQQQQQRKVFDTIQYIFEFLNFEC
jgi:hypothetical protein